MNPLPRRVHLPQLGDPSARGDACEDARRNEPHGVTGAPLADGWARRVTYLRVSLTDRCNYRCTYCMPEEGVALSPRSQVLSIEELARVIGALAAVGVRRVRLTGGEPTVRHGLIELIERLDALGLDDLAMTTNGHTLAEMAAPLRRAGLRRINISVDTLDPDRFRAITRWGDLARVRAGVEAARDAGFPGTKINVVALSGFNDRELPALAEWSWAHDATPRFIEWMPMSGGTLYAPGAFLAAATIREHLRSAFGPLTPDDGGGLPGVGPARYLRVDHGPHEGRRIGIISAVSEPFCETCNRVRLSASGQLHTCLAHDDTVDLRALIRGGGAGSDDTALVAAVRAGLSAKVQGHQFDAAGCGGPSKHMVAIGG